MFLRKVPTIIYLERSDLQSTVDFSQVPANLDPSILYQDTSIALFVSPLFTLCFPQNAADTEMKHL